MQEKISMTFYITTPKLYYVHVIYLAGGGGGGWRQDGRAAI